MFSLEGTSATAFFVHPKESAPPATATGPPTVEQPAPDTQAPPSTPAPAAQAVPAPATTQGPSTPAPATTQAPSTPAPASQNSVAHHDESNQESSCLKLC